MGNLRALWLPVDVAFRADRRRALLVPALSVVAGLSGVLHGLAVKWLIDSAVLGNAGATTAAAAALAAAVVLAHLVGTAGARIRMAFQQRIGFELDRRVLRLCTGVPTIGHLEHPEYLDRLEVLRTTGGQIGGAYGALIQDLRGVAQLAGILALLTAVDPWLLLLPAFVIPAAIATAATQRTVHRFEQQVAPDVRARRALLRLATSAPAAKELRVYGLADELATRHDQMLAGIQSRRHRIETRASIAVTAGRLVFTAGFVSAVALVAVRAVSGQASPGDVALVLVLAGQLDGALTAAVGLYGSIQRSVHASSQYFWLADHAAAQASQAPAGTAQASATRSTAARASALPAAGEPVLQHNRDIVLDGVTFAYPGAPEPVLRDVSLRLPPGGVIAIVGENGAGKSTLVKLLCGLYRPTGGQLRYGGTDLSDLGLARWRSLLTAGFQDFCRFELVAREAVGVGDLPSASDEIAVLTALGRAGADGLPGELPGGLDTQLGRSFDGGVDLSTGQWQRVALARAAMRAQPTLRVLDEPTASLDPEAEHALFRRYAELARAPGTATVTVLVSHRFSTVRAADLIIVLDRGRIHELGDHESLLDAGGRYAELYRLQARGYQDARAR